VSELRDTPTLHRHDHVRIDTFQGEDIGRTPDVRLGGNMLLEDSVLGGVRVAAVHNSRLWFAAPLYCHPKVCQVDTPGFKSR
jgi:hypothetical protein